MSGYFWLSFESLRPMYESTIAFELSMEQNTRRIAHICSAEFELWIVTDPTRNLGKFLSPLRPDIRAGVTDTGAQMVVQFKDQQRSRNRLLWHYTPEQLEEVEKIRAGSKVSFHVYARVVIQAIYQSPNQPPITGFEIDTPGRHGGWPLQIDIGESEWIALLSQIRFRHPVMDRVPWPSLPPRFRRAEEHLNDAWRYFRTNEPDACLSSCYKAFECLGFDLFGKEVERKDVLDLLMAGADKEKQDCIVALLRTLQAFFQLGRHDKRAPVQLTQCDAQMAVICTSTLLSYLAPREPLRRATS